ncbi:hypothetical protein KC318_g12156 [Hortaea werneckii]|nr:hypothetical protein KC334_g12366 [Hortaea werneckii]KAI6964151.1 hypothetical protein KC355_g12344 [Hortaea werneckii]KAI7656844.1 hypothetical protein KC318_g12156 [Hortaea werneckii]
MAAFRTALLKNSCASWSRLSRLRHFRALNFSTSQNRSQQTNGSENDDFYRYTSGRWLWNEGTRLQERYKQFNIPGLKSLAAKACGAQSCISIVKLAEGGFNKVFRLTMDNGAVVMARIPTPIVGPISRVLASEIATMDFVSTGPERSRYPRSECHSMGWREGLMEEAKGESLGAIWPDMELDEKLKVVEEIVAAQKKLQSVTFSKFGSMYHKSDAHGCSTGIDINGSLPQSTKTYAEDRFVTGPLAEKTFWEPEQTNPAIDRGPWSSAQSYLRAISKLERSKYPPDKSSPALQCDSDLLDSPQARLSLLHKFRAISAYLPPRERSLNRGTLFHWDLRLPNLFVEDGQITSLIDWQDAWVAPLFMQERRPQLLDYDGEMRLHLPEYFETMKDQAEKAKVQSQVEKSILSWQWNKLNTGIECPIQFSKEEIEAHEEASSDWNERAKFWASLSGFVSSDGYTSLEGYEDARELFEELRKEGFQSLSGKELTDFEDDQSKWVERPG